jgi:hypothetical protein
MKRVLKAALFLATLNMALTLTIQASRCNSEKSAQTLSRMAEIFLWQFITCENAAPTHTKWGSPIHKVSG